MLFHNERLLTFVVLRHHNVSHVIVFKDPQPPQLIINHTPFPLQFREVGACESVSCDELCA
jgi:hypothetical protein